MALEIGLIIQDLLDFTNAEVYAPLGLPASKISSIALDSRDCDDNCLFVALKGERTDGHAYIASAARAGASFFLVEPKEFEQRREEYSQIAESGGVFFLSDNTLKALQDAAQGYLRKRVSPFKIGITGSSGKTTTKEIIGAILREAGKTRVNPGNYNSEIGLPVAALMVKPEDEYAVFEMGINHKGEMNVLENIVFPDAGVITNIGSAHIGILGTRTAIAEEKRKIFSSFSTDQVACMWEDDDFFNYIAERTACELIPYGVRSTAGLEDITDMGLDGSIINWEGIHIRFPLIGKHNAVNALGAITLCSAIGISKEAIAQGLEKVRPLFGRGRITKGDVSFVEDYYNANPDSMVKAIDAFFALPWTGRKKIVLGAMKELGGSARHEHKKVFEHVRSYGVDMVFLFGEEWPVPDVPGSMIRTTDYSSLHSQFRDNLEPGDLVLVKGSRSMRLERLVAEWNTGNDNLQKKAAEGKGEGLV
ncbi:MAG: UDP-N-acetylmuramoyl-tripeptide--D-alanyl-D-alanine ligase [Spirochaetia bacterium]